MYECCHRRVSRIRQTEFATLTLGETYGFLAALVTLSCVQDSVTPAVGHTGRQLATHPEEYADARLRNALRIFAALSFVICLQRTHRGVSPHAALIFMVNVIFIGTLI